MTRETMKDGLYQVLLEETLGRGVLFTTPMLFSTTQENPWNVPPRWAPSRAEGECYSNIPLQQTPSVEEAMQTRQTVSFPKQTHTPAQTLAGNSSLRPSAEDISPYWIYATSELSAWALQKGRTIVYKSKTTLYVWEGELSLLSEKKDKRGIKRAKYLYY